MRYVYEAIPSGRGNDLTHPAVQGVMYCNKLFEYERKYAEKGLSPKKRHARRLKDEKPVIEAFLEWADSQPVTGSGRLSKAITYIRNRRNAMFTFLEYLLTNRPSADMTDEELDRLAPWNEDVKKACSKCENPDME